MTSRCTPTKGTSVLVQLEHSGIFRPVGEEGVRTQGISPVTHARHVVAHDEVGLVRGAPRVSWLTFFGLMYKFCPLYRCHLPVEYVSTGTMVQLCHEFVTTSQKCV